MITKNGTTVMLKIIAQRSYIPVMYLRRIKPVKIDTYITNKLKASNFISNLDDLNDLKPNISGQQKKQNLAFNPNIQKITTKNKQDAQNNKQVNHKIQRNTQKQQKQIQTNKKQVKVPKQAKIVSYSNKNTTIQVQKNTKNLQNALKTLGKALQSIDPKQLRNLNKTTVTLRQNMQIQTTITEMKKLQLKDFSILVHRLLVNSAKNNNTVEKYIWKQIQQDFLTRFEVTTNPIKIRSYSKVIYCLAKSKVHRDNSNTLVSTSISTNLLSLQTKFAILLPSASHQSFSMIVTSLSRMGPLSQQFSYITQRLYYQRYNQFNVRQRIQINYALTRNFRKVDSKLYTYIDSMNLKQILIMLRCYQNSNQISNNLLKIAQKNIIARKKQMNVIDIGDICAIYFQAMVKEGDPYKLSQELEKILTEMYKILKINMNEVTFEKIWKDLPIVANRGYLQVEFVQQIMKTLKIMRKKQLFPERIWKPLRQSFRLFENLQIRARLEQIK